MPLPGETIDGRFRIERVVGQGGMGIVVDAVNVHLDQHVALKFLRPDIERSPEVVARFEREVRSAVKLRSEHIARVSDVGSHPKLGPYMVMELLEGSTLAELLLTSGPFPIHRAAEYVIHACEGLAEAHARGIVHQDVKPANMFLVHGSDGRPLVKVLDFGISKLTDVRRSDTAEITITTTSGARSSNLGTPQYLSPEQLRSGAEVDRRADVWALGCVLFELVTGTKAFNAPRFTALVASILEAPRAGVPDHIDLPPALLEVIDRCLVKDREGRYGTTAELSLALLPFARRRAHSVASRAVAHVNASGEGRTLTMPSSMPPPPSESSLDLLSSPLLRAPRVPRVPGLNAASDSAPPSRRSSLPARSISSAVPAAPGAPSALSASPAAVAPAINQRTAVAFLLALLLLIVGAGLVLVLRDRGTAEPDPVASGAPSSSIASPAVSAVAVSGVPAAATGNAPTPSANLPANGPANTGNAPIPLNPTPGKPVSPVFAAPQRVPTVGTKPTAPLNAAPAPPVDDRPGDSEIRRTR